MWKLTRKKVNATLKIPRQIGLFTATCLIVGNLVGTGVFLLPSVMAPLNGIGILGWIISAGGAICLALIFSSLAREMPSEGGIYAYSRAAFGDYIGFQVAWNYWIATWTGNAAFLVGVPAYLSILFPDLATHPTLSLCVCLGILWGIVGLHCLGLKQATLFQNVATILKLIPLILIPIVGIFFMDMQNFSLVPLESSVTFPKGLAEASILTIWAFIGIESATIPALSIKNPSKTIPRATVLGTVITSFVYILGAVSILGVVGAENLQGTQAPYAVAAGRVFTCFPTRWIEIFVAVGAVISGIGSFNGWVILLAQMPFAASRDGLFPKLFERGMHKGTPIFGLIFSSMLVTILLVMSRSESLISQYAFIIKISTLCMLISYIYPTVASLILIKNRNATYKNWIRFILLFVGMGYILWTIFGAGQEIVFYGALFFFGSTPLYYWIKRK